ncbi:MAG: M14 family zinc carboxypeptidase [Planctomycetota bacterium]
MVVSIVSLCLAAAAAAQDPPAVQLLEHQALTAELHRLSDAYGHVELVSLGRSRDGHMLEGLRFGTKAEAAPAILLVANLDGPRVFTSGVALHHCRRLAEAYATDERVSALLDSTVVYVIPRANPDAAELRFAEPRFEHRAGGTGVDNDRDGREGEDGPADVNGDGVIATMRYADPDGAWIEDPTDPRALVKADPFKGERGRFKLVVEGRDSDGDERVAEDPAFDAVLNRNFASGWEQHEDYAGLFPTDAPEVRALADFMIGRRDLALVLTYDELDNLVEAPKTVKDDARAVKRVPAAGVRESDGNVLKELGKRYRDVTGAKAKKKGGDEGTFQRFSYDHRGLLTLEALLWDLPQQDPPKPEQPEDAEQGSEAGEEAAAEEEAPKRESKKDKPKPSEDAKRLAWIDAQGDAEAWRFVPWTPFEHPELGPVEIGGFAPFARLDPPAGEWDAIADKHLDFLLGLGELLPRVELVECTMEPVGEGLWRVEAAVENAALLPLQSRSARRTRTVRPAKVELVLPEAATLVAGRHMQQLSELDGSGGRFEASWLVLGPEDMEVGVSVDTDNAGTDRRKAEVIR